MVMPYLYRVLVLHLGFGLGIDQFELDFLDMIDSISKVVHFNLLTERLTPILPDVQGKPALGLGDRFIAFSGLGGNGETDPAGPTDLFAVDVQAAVLRPLDIPGSRDREPSFAPNLEVLTCVSSRESWNDILVLPRLSR